MNIFRRILSWFKPSAAPSYESVVNQRPLSLIDVMINVARGELGVTEVTRNQAPRILEYWKATSYGIAGHANREAWCATFLAWVLQEAAKAVFPAEIPFRLPRSARVLDWPTWADTDGDDWERLSPKTTKVKRGDIVCWDFNGPNPSGTHIGLAIEDEKPGGTFATIEGNTDDSGSREGKEVAQRTRTRSSAIAIIRYSGI